MFETDLQNDYLYFNGISCASESSCVAVAEGYNADGSPLTVAYTTTDGGAAWTRTHESNTDMSISSASAVSDTEYWIAAAMQDAKRQLYGQFYHSVDAGLTWTLEHTVGNCYPIDMDWGDKVGFAACVSSSGTSSSVAVYK